MEHLESHDFGRHPHFHPSDDTADRFGAFVSSYVPDGILDMMAFEVVVLCCTYQEQKGFQRGKAFLFLVRFTGMVRCRSASVALTIPL